MNLAAYVTCLQEGKDSGVEPSGDDIDDFFRSPLVKHVSPQALVRLVKGNESAVDLLAKRSVELLGKDAYLLPEVAALVEDSTSLVVLASGLVSPERFQAAYQEASREARTVLQVSPYLTEEQADEYVADLTRAFEEYDSSIRNAVLGVLAKYYRYLPPEVAGRVDYLRGVLADSSDDRRLREDLVGEGLVGFPLAEMIMGYGWEFEYDYGLDLDESFDMMDRLYGVFHQMEQEVQPQAVSAEFRLSRWELMAATKSWVDSPVRPKTLEAFLALVCRYGVAHDYTHMSHLAHKAIVTTGGLSRDLSFGANASDPHTMIAVAASHTLGPSQRPVSPVVELVRRAVVPVEAGERYLFPESPTRWGQLSDKVNSVSFQYPEAVRDLDGVSLPEHPGVTLTLVKSSVALKANSERMGNCTNGYAGRAQGGQWAVFRFEVGEVEHNASIDIYQNAYEVGEINTRFNRGGVTPEVQKAFTELVAGLNA